MNLSAGVFLAIALLLLALEHFGATIPGFITGIFLIIAAILIVF